MNLGWVFGNLFTLFKGFQRLDLKVPGLYLCPHGRLPEWDEGGS